MMPTPTYLLCLGCEREFAASKFPNSGQVCIKCLDDLSALRDAHRASCEDTSTPAFLSKIAETQKARKLNAKQVQVSAEQKAIQEELDRRQAIEDELASAALARVSLLHYVERRIGSKYKSSWLQEDIARRIEKFVEDIEEGTSPRLILQLPPRSGKALAHSTPMFTFSRGWTTHGELQVGDIVADINGEPTGVVAVSPETVATIEITFNTGEKLTCHEDHEWVVYDKCSKHWRVMEARELLTSNRGTKRKLYSGTPGKRGSQYLYAVPAPPPLHIADDIDLPMDPYTLGAWLGDGTSTRARISHADTDQEVVDAIAALGYEITHRNYGASGCTTTFGRVNGTSRLMNEIRELGLVDNKHIPEIYFRASDRQRRELLAGLVDTDGCVSEKTSEVKFDNSNPRLRDGFVKLARSLGQRPGVSVRPPRDTGFIRGKPVRSKQTSFSVRFTPNAWVADTNLRIPRKGITNPRPLKSDLVSITSVERGRPEPGKCIQVGSPYGVYLAGQTLTPTHNSELASDSGPAWILGHHPDWTVMITSYSDELPTAWSRSIRDQLKTEDYRRLFPNGGVVNKYDSSAKAWSTEQGGSVRAAGAGGSILGFGAHVAVVDDPIKGSEDADNPATLEKLWDWMTSTLYSRLAPGGGILLIMQRWSEDDLVGRFLGRVEADKKEVEELRAMAKELQNKPRPTDEDIDEADHFEAEADELEESMDEWDVVKYPALATGDEYLTDEGKIVSLSKDESPEQGWRMLRKRGDALHPERYSRSYYLKLKRNNPRRFAAMYQQTPVIDDGDYFSRSDFANRYRRSERPPLRFMTVYCTWDLAIGTQQANNHTVGLAAAVDHTGELWLLQRIRGKFGDLDQIADMVLDLHIRWGASMTGIERGHLEMALGPILRRKQRDRGVSIALAEGKQALKPITDKKVRARQYQAMAKAGMVRVPEGDDWDEYIDWLVKFGSTTTDDDVDASAWLAIMVNRSALPNDPKGSDKENEKSWYDELMDDYGLRSGDMPDERAYMAS